MNITLNNFGLVQKTLPPDILNYLLLELIDITEHKPMISGMSAPGVPKHYYLKDSQPLKQYVLKTCVDYFTTYNPAVNYKNLSDGVDPSSKVYALEPWVNVQTKHEWIPPHDHSGIMAYTIWMTIPEPNIFEILYSTITGETMKHQIQITKKQQGTILLFPAKLIHTVHPFHNSDDNRISISGNLMLN